MELIKDYDLEVHYHPSKANVVADALSRKARCNCMNMDVGVTTLCDDDISYKLSILSDRKMERCDALAVHLLKSFSAALLLSVFWSAVSVL